MSVAGRLSRELENDIADAWRAIDAGSSQPIPARRRIPHLSFQPVARGPTPALIEDLKALADEWSPVPIRLGGLGVFEEPRPVLYITVVRSPRLEALQQAVTLRLADHGHRPDPLYQPEAWVPHVTLAFGTPGIAGWKQLLEQTRQGVFHRRATVESLLMVSTDRRAPLLLEAPFGGTKIQRPGGDEQNRTP